MTRRYEVLSFSTRGSRVYLPVYVPGGNLSMGDLHFSQGDGEVRPVHMSPQLKSNSILDVLLRRYRDGGYRDSEDKHHQRRR